MLLTGVVLTRPLRTTTRVSHRITKTKTDRRLEKMPDLDLNLFSPTQRRIMELLKDGRSKTRYEVAAAIDEQADYRSLRVHIHAIRKILEPLGLDVVCINSGYMKPARYRLVRRFSIIG